MTSIENFTQALCAIPDTDFTQANISNVLHHHPIDVESLSPYLYFNHDRYTRNLICRTPLFELLVICWEKGQHSGIHEHQDQKCWMSMIHGKIEIKDFKLLHKDPQTQTAHLELTRSYVIDGTQPAEVDPEEPIHQVSNIVDFDSRAVTLHIYSRPFANCEVYNLADKSYQMVDLVNTSEFGKLKLDIQTHPFQAIPK